MDPVTLLVTALVAGAGAIGAGALEATKDAAKDSVGALYARLKSLIARRGEQAGWTESGAGKLLQQHESNPDGYDVPVRDLIAESGADGDDEIVALAKQLLAARDAQDAGSGMGGVRMTALATGHGRVYQAGGDQHISEK